jgi:hypothetical protein
MVTERVPIEDWATLPWRKLERVVYRLQRRIYRIPRLSRLSLKAMG